MAHGDKLSRKQEQAIAALLSQPSIAKAAAVVGIHGRTLQNWLVQPAFARAYTAARQSVLDRGLVRFQVGLASAVQVLEKALKAKKLGDRLRAADIFLRHGLKAIDQLDVLARLRALEEKLEASDGTETDYHP